MKKSDMTMQRNETYFEYRQRVDRRLKIIDGIIFAVGAGFILGFLVLTWVLTSQV